METQKTQLENDFRFIGGLLPQHYDITVDKKHKSSFRCKSSIGISDQTWERFTQRCREFFGKRLSEFYHEVNYQHTDFVVYLRSEQNVQGSVTTDGDSSNSVK